MGPWWLYLIVFLFGYLTCRIFYFVREVRIGLVMLKVSHCLSLYCLVKGIEHMEYARSLRVGEMRDTGVSERNIQAFNLNFDGEVERFKRRSVAQIVELHPSFYRDVVKFTDWETAMHYLETEGKEYLKLVMRGKII